MRLGRHIVIKPTWRDYEPQPDDVIIALDPGMAFGTGLHPTTRLCLVGLERWADAGLVAWRHGARRGLAAPASWRWRPGCSVPRRLRAVDTDPIAVESTLENAAPQRCRHRCATTAACPSTAVPSTWCFANLVASLLVELAAELADGASAG